MPVTYATYTTPEGKSVRTTLFITYATAQRLRVFKQVGKNIFVVPPADTALTTEGLLKILQENKQSTVSAILPTLVQQSKVKMRLATDKELAAYNKLKAGLAKKALANHMRGVKRREALKQKEIKAAVKVFKKYGMTVS